MTSSTSGFFHPDSLEVQTSPPRNFRGWVWIPLRGVPGKVWERKRKNILNVSHFFCWIYSISFFRLPEFQIFSLFLFSLVSLWTHLARFISSISHCIKALLFRSGSGERLRLQGVPLQPVCEVLRDAWAEHRCARQYWRWLALLAGGGGYVCTKDLRSLLSR